MIVTCERCKIEGPLGVLEKDDALQGKERRPRPNLARSAARTLSKAVVEADDAAPVQLLADLRDLLASTAADTLATAAIIRHLITLEDRPWADYAQGHAITPRHLATLLEGFGCPSSAPTSARE